MANYVPLLKTTHAQMGCLTYSGYEFANGVSLVPMVLSELAKAQQVLPLAFVKQAEGFTLTAVLGLSQGQNLFVAPNGKWMASYLPAAFRSYPFRLLNTKEGQQLLGFDEDSGLMSESGKRFFDDSGDPSKYVKDVMGFLQTVEKERIPTERLCTLLDKHKLLVPWDVQLKLAEGVKALKGFYRVNEKALATLSGEALEELTKSGAMSLIYCQLLSMQNIAKLQSLQKLHVEYANKADMNQLPQDERGELDLEFLKDDDTFKF